MYSKKKWEWSDTFSADLPIQIIQRWSNLNQIELCTYSTFLTFFHHFGERERRWYWWRLAVEWWHPFSSWLLCGIFSECIGRTRFSWPRDFHEWRVKRVSHATSCNTITGVDEGYKIISLLICSGYVTCWNLIWMLGRWRFQFTYVFFNLSIENQIIRTCIFTLWFSFFR